jgi:DNA-binding LacI/PurR family transcriptional regulator
MTTRNISCAVVEGTQCHYTESMERNDAKQTHVTIYDVAEAAGVSASTVSRAFARPGRVSYETAEHIRQVARELGYRATKIERPMPESSSGHGIIALMVADITNPVFFDLIRGAEEEATKNNYTLLLANARESATRERGALERSIDIIDGILLSSSRLPDSAIRAIAKQRPTIVMNRGVKGVSSIATDNVSGIRKILSHLRDLGHHQVAYLAGPEASWANGIRWAAIKRLAPEYSIHPTALMIPQPTPRGGATAAKTIIAGPYTAVIGYNDQVAVGVLKELIHLGAKVPEDFSVVGFDNSSAADLVTPGLTSVAAPLEVLGATAVKNLLALTRGAATIQEEPILLPTRLVTRDSSGPARP